MNNANQTLLDAAWRVERMVGRRNELQLIKSAIHLKPGDTRCSVVLITGSGGIGKSRLLEEIQNKYQYPARRRREHSQNRPQLAPDDDWSELGNVTVSDVIDLMDVRLSARTQILQALRNALTWPGGVDFYRYDSAIRNYQRAVENSASYQLIESRTAQVEAAFWQDFELHAATQRIVLMLDTAERLVLRSSGWLIERDLLTSEEMVLSSQQWLISQLRIGRLKNTTLVIAGRDGASEGGKFFDELRSILKETASSYSLVEVPLTTLDQVETQAYFESLAEEWQKRAEQVSSDRLAKKEYQRISRSVLAVADDRDRLEVLNLVTGGRPVLLSLYADLILESEQIPAQLQFTPEEARASIDQLGHANVQAEIERSFINLLFQQPGPRSDIMRALARCPAGLSAEQLHFLIDSDRTGDLASWRPTSARVDEINSHLEQIRRLSLARPRADGRLGLQDEIYRIYAARMSDTAELVDFEREERLTQYEKLSQWASYQLHQLRAFLRKYQELDQRRITAAIRRPNDALHPYIPSPTASEQDERGSTQRSIWDWELEQLHYDLLRDPASCLNNDYLDLTERRWHANNEEMDFVAQQEMWRVLHDQNALQFTKISTDRPFGEAIAVLRRMALEEDPARWIKRFILRGQFLRALEFYKAVEDTIAIEPKPERRTWQHPLNVSERKIWRDYAQIMVGQSVAEAVRSLENACENLLLLTKRGMNEVVDTLGVTGFIGHPALPRIYRILAVGYNYAGYGYTAPLGKYKEGVDNYGLSLLYIRLAGTETKKVVALSDKNDGPLAARQAATRNNLARALASLGREERGYRVCADALSLRRSVGAEIPIAISLNTLALINNSMQRTLTAWQEAAQAAAICRRAEDNRGLGLALIQLGIGLRRLANSGDPIATLDTLPEELYASAQAALGEAVDIFSMNSEVLRLVEATLELGCVLRDQMRLIHREHATQQELQRLSRFRRDAENELQRAIDFADKHRFDYLALQAHVDLAWTHFFAGDFESSEATAKEAELRVPANYLISGQRFPGADADESHYFYQLAKVQGIYAGVAMARFKERREILRLVSANAPQLYEQVRTDKDANAHFEKAAEHYVLALYYGQMFSPRSRSLVITFDHIYEHVKGFNTVEYEMFYRSQHVATAKYRDSDKPWSESSRAIYPFDFSKLEDWLKDCFGPLEDIQEEDQLEARNELS